MVIMDRQDYIHKSNQLLSQPVYRAVPRDPSNKIKTKVGLSWKNWFFTVSTLGGCSGPEELTLTVSTLGGCGGLGKNSFSFLCWEGVLVLKELIYKFLLWEGVLVLKELIFNSFYFGRVWWSWKNWLLKVSSLGGHGGLPKIHKWDTPLRPIVSSCGSVTYGVSKELSKILKPLVGKSLHHINSTQALCWTGQKYNFIILGMPQLLWCYSTVHLSFSRSSPRHYQWSTGKRHHPQGKNSNVSSEHSSFIRIFPPNYLLFLPRPVLWIDWGCDYGFPSKANCS